MHDARSETAPRDPLDVLAALESEEARREADAGTASGSGGALLEEYRPIVDSLAWDLSDLYWRQDGLLPFLRGDVPHAVNNTGWASERAAAVLFAACEQAPADAPIRILEVGAGLGLFARFLLDAFRRICAEGGRDFYDRLTFHITDGSGRTIAQWRERQLFADHAEHVELGTLDALQPDRMRDADGGTIEIGDLTAVFASYVLDVLPLALVRRGKDGAEQMCVQTRLPGRHHEQLARLGFEPDELPAIAAGDGDRARLLPLLPYFEFATEMRRDGADALPHVHALLDFAGDAERAVLNTGALDFLERGLDTIAAHGFVLVNDYGPTRAEDVEDMASVTWFGSSISACVNFPFLEHQLTAAGHVIMTPPRDDDRSIHTMLLAKNRDIGVAAAFERAYADDRPSRSERASAEAGSHAQAGRHAEALAAYRAAIEACPGDWMLLGNASQFLNQQLLRHPESLELARAAIAINPWQSAFLYNCLGNSLYCLERFDDAYEAYLRARAIDPEDPQTHLNLAYSHAHAGNGEEALQAVARGLACDAEGRFEAVLLRKQQEILEMLSEQRRMQSESLSRRQSLFRAGR